MQIAARGRRCGRFQVPRAPYRLYGGKTRWLMFIEFVCNRHHKVDMSICCALPGTWNGLELFNVVPIIYSQFRACMQNGGAELSGAYMRTDTQRFCKLIINHKHPIVIRRHPHIYVSRLGWELVVAPAHEPFMIGS